MHEAKIKALEAAADKVRKLKAEKAPQVSFMYMIVTKINL